MSIVGAPRYFEKHRVPVTVQDLARHNCISLRLSSSGRIYAWELLDGGKAIEVRVTDDGHGFEVGRALARAAQRGRLGIVGIGERVRMLGGTFEIDSAPGGPTILTFALPRVSPDDRSAFR